MSDLLLRGKIQNLPLPETRLYRFGPDGVTLFAERGDLAPQSGGGSDDGVTGPQVSGDGTVVGYTLRDICPTPGACDDDYSSVDAISTEGILKGAQNLNLGPGALKVSRNGRWALLTTMDDSFAPSSVLVDLKTGARNSVPSPIAQPDSDTWDEVVPPASDGTLLVYQSLTDDTGVTGLWKQGQFTAIQFPIGVDYDPVWLSDDASTLISSTSIRGPRPPYPDNLVATNLATGKPTVLYQGKSTSQTPYFMAVSNNGQIVLYRLTPNTSFYGPAYIANAATGQTTPIALASGELANDGTLTGAGDIAFVSITKGRIVKVAVATGAVTTLFPATPVCDNPGFTVAGSLVLLNNCTFSGTVADLQGKLVYNDTPMAIVSSEPGQIVAQVPWQVYFYFDTLYLNTSAATPFQAAIVIEPMHFRPEFFLEDADQNAWLCLDLIKSDWSGLLNAQPKPGDIFYAYMTGLGPVVNPVTYGEPASLTVPNPTVYKLQCQLEPHGETLEVLFSGLAPGTIGIYQVAFRMPAPAGPKPVTWLYCASGYAVGILTLPQ